MTTPQILAAAGILALTLSAPAGADGIVASSTGPRGARTVLITDVPYQGSVVLRVESREGSARDRAWVRYCQPTERTDSLGVTRLSYAHAGCEHGAIGPVTTSED
jgi:hypothetical protein